jgi:hypothetical protein
VNNIAKYLHYVQVAPSALQSDRGDQYYARFLCSVPFGLGRGIITTDNTARKLAVATPSSIVYWDSYTKQTNGIFLGSAADLPYSPVSLLRAGEYEITFDLPGFIDNTVPVRTAIFAVLSETPTAPDFAFRPQIKTAQSINFNNRTTNLIQGWPTGYIYYYYENFNENVVKTIRFNPALTNAEIEVKVIGTVLGSVYLPDIQIVPTGTAFDV